MKSKIRLLPTGLCVAMVAFATANVTFAQSAVDTPIFRPAPERQPTTLTAGLSGLEEVPPLFTEASGSFTATCDHAAQACKFRLSYRGLMSVMFAGIHFGQRGVNGGVSVTLCDDMTDSLDVEPCPMDSGTVEGTIKAKDVVGPEERGIGPGEIERLLVAMFAEATYVNVHTDEFAAGELRGQIKPLRFKCTPFPWLDQSDLRCIPPVLDADEEGITPVEPR